jgi:hypothetical protein
MNYFKSLPKILIIDGNTSIVATNLMARASIIADLLKNPLLLYSYDIQDTDTPEIIAHKYYGDVERYWLVMFANQLLDPQWDWPMNGRVFSDFLDKKYTPETLVDAHHYEKIITQTDSGTNTVTTETIIIDSNTYSSLTPSITSYTLPTGIVTVDVSKRIVDNYTYEVETNESKRNIKLLNKVYASQMEDQLNTLMRK